MSDMYNELEDTEITGGNFTAHGDAKMFEKAKELKLGGGFYLATTKRLDPEESDYEGDAPEMFKGLEKSKLSKGVYVSEGGAKMFEKSKGLVITGGDYTASGRRTTPRKPRNTTKSSQPLASASSAPVSFNPTPSRPTYLESQSVPAQPSGPTHQGVTTFGASVQLQHTVPTLPSHSEGQDYFSRDVPNHEPTNRRSDNNLSTPMDVDANGGSSELDTGKGKRKDGKLARVTKMFRDGQS